jgi:hypothetical protein
MKYFKYFLFVLTALFSIQSYAVCHHPATYPGIAHKPFPNTVCYPEDGTGNGFCKFNLVRPPFNVEVPCTNSDGCVADAYAVDLVSVNDRVYINSNCTTQIQDGCVQLPNGNIECEEEEEEENDPVLQCSSDSCPNPDNKRCPTGYTRGSFNGQNLCVKHTPNDDDDEDEECNDPNGCDESNDEIIAAIDRANNDITNSTNSLGQTLTDALNSVKNALGDIADKLQNLADSMINGNNGPDQNTNQPPDTSQFNADLPVEDVEINQNLDTGLYSSNSQCPAKKIINIPQYGLHYEFDFSEICNMLQIFGYLVLLFAYVVAARIVIKS